MRDRDLDWIIAAYIMASRRNGTLYTDMTSNLVRRVGQHREGTGTGFAARYLCNRLVWYQSFELVTSAIAREEEIKAWRRAWKLQLIEAGNPQWLDLAEPWFVTP